MFYVLCYGIYTYGLKNKSIMELLLYIITYRLLKLSDLSIGVGGGCSLASPYGELCKFGGFLWVLCYNLIIMSSRYEKLLGIWKEMKEEKTPSGYPKVFSPYTLLYRAGITFDEYCDLTKRYIAGELIDDEKSFARKLGLCIQELMSMWNELALAGRANWPAVKDTQEKFSKVGFASEKEKTTMLERMKSYKKLQETPDNEGELKF